MQLFTLMLNVFPNVMFQRFIPQYSCDCLFKSWFDALTALPMSCCPLFLETLLSQLVYGFIPTLGLRREHLEEEGLGGVYGAKQSARGRVGPLLYWDISGRGHSWPPYVFQDD